MDNTTLAAIEFPNGQRRVFFQDRMGVVNQGLYTPTAEKWDIGTAGTSNVTGDNARNNTPLAAVFFTDLMASDESNVSGSDRQIDHSLTLTLRRSVVFDLCKCQQ